MGWSSDWEWGVPVLVLTVVVHVCVLVLISAALVRAAPRAAGKFGASRFIVAVALTALGAAALHAFEAGAWAVLYLRLGALENFKTAMLYSLNAITAYGHANIFLSERWQLLGAIEAVNGVILFGLTTAFLFAAIQEVWPVSAPRRWRAREP